MAAKPEDAILSACCALDLNSEHRERLCSASRNAVDWTLVYRAAAAHKIAPLVHRNLKLCETLIGKLPKEVEASFLDHSRRSAMRKLIVAHGLADVADYFDHHDHDVLVLKHTSYYFQLRPLFDLTTADDTDLACRPRSEATDAEVAPYLWRSNGIPDATWRVIDGLIHSPEPRMRMLSLEMDNRLHHDVVWNGVIPLDFRRIWNDAVAFEIHGKTVFVPEIHDLVIISAVNLFRKPFVRLRNLLEIHELVQLHDQFNWDTLADKARSYQCDALVYSAICSVEATLKARFIDSAKLKIGGIKSSAIAMVSRRISPCAIAMELPARSAAAGYRRGVLDLSRRLFALNYRQLGRFIWFRLILRRFARMIPH